MKGGFVEWTIRRGREERPFALVTEIRDGTNGVPRTSSYEIVSQADVVFVRVGDEYEVRKVRSGDTGERVKDVFSYLDDLWGPIWDSWYSPS